MPGMCEAEPVDLEDLDLEDCEIFTRREQFIVVRFAPFETRRQPPGNL